MPVNDPVVLARVSEREVYLWEVSEQRGLGSLSKTNFLVKEVLEHDGFACFRILCAVHFGCRPELMQDVKVLYAVEIKHFVDRTLSLHGCCRTRSVERVNEFESDVDIGDVVCRLFDKVLVGLLVICGEFPRGLGSVLYAHCLDLVVHKELRLRVYVIISLDILFFRQSLNAHCLSCCVERELVGFLLVQVVYLQVDEDLSICD